MGHLLKLKFAHSPLKRDSVKRFFASGFLHESSSPKPLKIRFEPFQFFFQICGDILKSRRTNGINDTGDFATSTAGVVGTVANLPPVSITLFVANNGTLSDC